MITMKAGLAIAVAMVATSAFAGGFRYNGPPKLGWWSYVPASSQGQASRAVFDANASAAVLQAPRSAFKGGIGHREP